MPREPFLRQVARYYLERDGADLYQRTFVFPTKKAQSFFLRYLSELTRRTALAPRCTTISEFIGDLKPSLHILDRTELLFKLYGHYHTILGANSEPFDEFIFWGDIILRDFDEIDRELVDARMLYSNLHGLRELEDREFPYLSNETKSLIASYWKQLAILKPSNKGEQKDYRERFLAFWESLGALYQSFRESCQRDKQCYEGYLYRCVAEESVEIVDTLATLCWKQMSDGRAPFVFVGLFQLSASERKLLKQMRRRSVGEFVWDEEVTIILDEAHLSQRILSEHIQAFGRVNYTEVFGKKQPKDYLPDNISVYRGASTLTQIKALAEILQANELIEAKDLLKLETAIVLPDEQLLLPIASSIPESFESVNISMGYPLNKTHISTFISRWSRLIKLGYKEGTSTVPDLVNFLHTQFLAEHYPGVKILANNLLKQRNYILTRRWIVDKYMGYLEHKLQGEELGQLLAAKPLIRLLLTPLEDALGFLSNLEEVLGMVELALLDIDRSEDKNTKSRTPISFELNFLKHYQSHLAKVKRLIQEYNYTDLGADETLKLLDELAQETKIPFKGDPIRGLQIIGLPVSQMLNFPNLVFISTEEGKLPKKKYNSTFIPWTLRKAFGLTTPTEQDTYDAYYFYQSISRCERLILVYGEEDSRGGRGEVTRYLNQMRMLYGVADRITYYTIELPPQAERSTAILIDKSSPRYRESITKALQRWTTNCPEKYYLSASAFNTYLTCPLRFYFEYICNSREDEEVEDLISSKSFGTILHKAMEILYGSYIGQEVTQELLDGYLSSKALTAHAAVQEAYSRFYSIAGGSKKEFNALDNYNITLIASYVKTILRHDRAHAPFLYLHPELECYLSINIGSEDELDSTTKSIRFKGIIDRTDLIELNVGSPEAPNYKRVLRIIDYKTGSDTNTPFTVQELFDTPSEYKAIIQTLLYCEMLSHGYTPSGILSHLQEQSYSVCPGLLITRQMSPDPEGYNPYFLVKAGVGTSKRSQKLILHDYMTIRDEYMALVRSKLTELFDLNTPFYQCEDKRHCKYCSFKEICHR